jgi:hypothetical protein
MRCLMSCHGMSDLLDEIVNLSAGTIFAATLMTFAKAAERIGVHERFSAAHYRYADARRADLAATDKCRLKHSHIKSTE